MFDMEIKDLAPIRVASIRHVGPFCELKPAFEKVCGWAGAKGLFREGTRVLGVYHDDPKTTPEKELKSDAAVTVDDSIEADPAQGIEITEVAGGLYAIGVHKGPYEALEKAYGWIYCTWLPSSDYVPLPKASYEVYLNDESTVAKEELLTAIHIPVQRK